MAEKIELVPWDASSEEHVKRMFDQRVACGWKEDEVEEWRGRQTNGTRFMYWIVSIVICFFFGRDADGEK